MFEESTDCICVLHNIGRGRAILLTPEIVTFKSLDISFALDPDSQNSITSSGKAPDSESKLSRRPP